MNEQRPLHIVIDTRWIFREISGIGLHSRELVRALLRIDSPHRFSLLFDDPHIRDRTIRDLELDRFPATSIVDIGCGLFDPRGQWLLPRRLRTMKADVYHSTNYMMPLWPARNMAHVITIHDLIPLLFRDHAPRSKKNRLFPLYQWIMKRVVDKSDAVIAVSESTAADIRRHLLPPGSRKTIRVVPNGVHKGYTPDPSVPKETPPVILYVGRRDPYKNLPSLIRAFHRIRQSGREVALRVIGPPDSRYPEAEETARSLGVYDNIDWIGYCSDDDLLNHYRKATLFVLPSRYEGFGLPVVEAMACGTPVICGNRSSLPEVAGDAAICIDPDDDSQLVEAMTSLLDDPDKRDALAASGLARAASFSWDNAARQTLDLYEFAAGLNGAR